MTGDISLQLSRSAHPINTVKPQDSHFAEGSFIKQHAQVTSHLEDKHLMAWHRKITPPRQSTGGADSVQGNHKPSQGRREGRTHLAGETWSWWCIPAKKKNQGSPIVCQAEPKHLKEAGKSPCLSFPFCKRRIETVL